MGLITRIADKAGALGSVVSTMGCAACFPALASLGAAIGLDFLQEYEGLFISKLLPLFAVVALLANALGWLSHRHWHRSLLGMIGPSIVFARTVWLLGNWWTANLVYVRGIHLGFCLACEPPLRPGRLRTAPSADDSRGRGQHEKIGVVA
jgi:mercuric ion transport protein